MCSAGCSNFIACTRSLIMSLLSSNSNHVDPRFQSKYTIPYQNQSFRRLRLFMAKSDWFGIKLEFLLSVSLSILVSTKNSIFLFQKKSEVKLLHVLTPVFLIVLFFQSNPLCVEGFVLAIQRSTVWSKLRVNPVRREVQNKNISNREIRRNQKREFPSSINKSPHQTC